MRRVTRLSTISALVALCAAPVLSAQAETIKEEIDRARQFLNSPLWVTKAWGAYLAGRLHSDELKQDLIDQFGPAALLRDSPWISQEHAFVTVLLDAAIEAGIRVPSALLEPFEKRWTTQVLILLARNQDREDSLLRLRNDQKSRDPLWLAVNNLLFERKSQRWYEAILGEISITHRFVVMDPGGGPGFGGGGGAGVCADGVTAMPKGFPPVTLYAVEDTPWAGTVVLAPGPRNVYYKRTVVPTGKQVGVGYCDAALDRMTARIEYLARLRGESAQEAERLFRSETYIEYTSVEDFAREAERALTEQEQRVREFIRGIEKTRLRTPDIRLRIVPEVADQRRNAKDRLPAVPVRDFDLR
ncbi:MAG: hypothetical protein ACM3S5_09710 [Rhodospirillales bacterium]